MEEEHVEDPEDEEEGELGGKEGEEPLAGVHLGGQPDLLHKMITISWQKVSVAEPVHFWPASAPSIFFTGTGSGSSS